MKKKKKNAKDPVLKRHTPRRPLFVLALDIFSKEDLISFTTHTHEFCRSSLLCWRLLTGHVNNAVLGVCEDFDRCLGISSRDLRRNQNLVVVAEQRTLPLRGSTIDLQASNAADKTAGAIVNAHRLLCEPWVGKALVNCESLLRVDNQHGINEVHYGHVSKST